MEYEKQWVVDTLNRLGFTEEAEAAARELPDPVPEDQLLKLGDRFGISRDELTSRMGGSP